MGELLFLMFVGSIQICLLWAAITFCVVAPCVFISWMFNPDFWKPATKGGE